ncbi:hypothetical protein JW905_14125, partial [bacterium]|nr:hypothetical protein [candidate division CSSED10-310 bacterium]
MEKTLLMLVVIHTVLTAVLFPHEPRLPLLLFGVLIAGALLGRPDQEGLIPSAWVNAAVGGNSL